MLPDSIKDAVAVPAISSLTGCLENRLGRIPKDIATEQCSIALVLAFRLSLLISFVISFVHDSISFHIEKM